MKQMNREKLKELGLTDEQIDSVMAEHGKAVNTTKEELKTAQTEAKSLKGQLKERDEQLEDLKVKATGNEELTKQIQALAEQNKQATADYEAKLSQQAFDYALKDALLGAKAKNPKAVEALLNREAIKLDGDKLLGLDEQLKAIKESDTYLFDADPEPNNPKPKFSSGQSGAGGSGEPTSLAEALAERFSN